MHIYYGVPYSLTKNIGEEYNRYMRLLPSDNDWMVFMDGDICFLNFDWGHIIAESIKKNPNAGIITCMTNRVAKNKIQLYGEDSPDILVHRVIAKKLDEQFRGTHRIVNQRIAGFLMAIKKKTWKEVGKFPELPNKILDVDGLFSRRVLSAGKSIVLMRGLYVFHYYRLAEGKKYKNHLRDATKYVNSHPQKINIRGRNVRKKNIRNLKSIKKRRSLKVVK